MASGGDIKAGGAYVEVVASDAELQAGFARAEARLKGFGGTARAFGGTLLAAGTSVATGLAGATLQFAELGDALDEMSVKTGIGVESLSALRYAASFSSIDMDKLGGSVAKMQKAIASGSPALAKLGLDMGKLAKASPEEQLGMIADAINAIDDPAQKAAAAMSIFGKSGTDLLPFLAEGSAGIGRLTQEARDLGVTMTGEGAASAAAFDDSLTKLKTGVGALTMGLGAALAPALTAVIDKILPLIPAASAWLAQNQGLVVTVAVLAGGVTLLGGGIVVLGTIFSALGTVVAAVGTGLGVITGLFGILSAAVAVVGAPIALLIGGLALLAGWFLTATKPGQALVSWIGGAFVSAFQTGWAVVTKFVEIVKGALDGLWSYIKPVLEGLGLLGGAEIPAPTASPSAAPTAASPAAKPAQTESIEELAQRTQANARRSLEASPAAAAALAAAQPSTAGEGDVPAILREIKMVAQAILEEVRSGGSADVSFG